MTTELEVCSYPTNKPNLYEIETVGGLKNILPETSDAMHFHFSCPSDDEWNGLLNRLQAPHDSYLIEECFYDTQDKKYTLNNVWVKEQDALSAKSTQPPDVSSSTKTAKPIHTIIRILDRNYPCVEYQEVFKDLGSVGDLLPLALLTYGRQVWYTSFGDITIDTLQLYSDCFYNVGSVNVKRQIRDEHIDLDPEILQTLQYNNVSSKIMEFLFVHNSEHHQALVDRKIALPNHSKAYSKPPLFTIELAYNEDLDSHDSD